jgi:nicotinate-nucleotide adenylyltransferase
LAVALRGSKSVRDTQVFVSVMALRRAAIYGGTFNPVHNGHLDVARRVQKLFSLDEVIFVPACVPPHKRGADISSAFHRFAMLALATEHEEWFRISTIELDRPDRPYAIETVAAMQEKLGAQYRLYFMMGADSWSEIKTWRDWQRLLKLSDQIVVTRPGYDLSATAVEGTTITDARGLSAKDIAALTGNSTGPQTFFTDAVLDDASSTAIREAARSGDRQKLRQMVPAAVAGYIEKYKLYQV